MNQKQENFEKKVAKKIAKESFKFSHKKLTAIGKWGATGSKKMILDSLLKMSG